MNSQLNCYLIWGKDPISKMQTNKAYEYKDNANKQEIVKVYSTSTALITLNKGGAIYKTGRLNFEKKNKQIDPNIPELILLKNIGSSVNYAATKMSLGDNHVLILTNNNLLFSWGDNYFGQLGLNNYLIPIINTPQMIRLLNVEQIKAYKNNSFAIDSKKVLLI